MTIDTSQLALATTVAHEAVPRGLCVLAVGQILRAPARPGTVLRRGVDTVDAEVRLCHQVDIAASIATRAVEAAMLAAATTASRGASVDWCLDGALYNRYPVSGMFRTHTDTSEDPRDPPCVRNRRLTLVCFLNDSVDDGVPSCEGGALVIYERREGLTQALTVRPQAGTIVAFDAGFMHEVRPVLRGERFSAVAWLYSNEET